MPRSRLRIRRIRRWIRAAWPLLLVLNPATATAMAPPPGAAAQVPEPPFRPGVVRLRLAPEAAADPAFLLSPAVRRAPRTGLADVDQALQSHGLVAVAMPSVIPARPDIARATGLDRELEATLAPGADVLLAARDLAALPAVEDASPDWAVVPAATPTDSLYSLQWGHRNTRQMQSCSSSACNTPANCHAIGSVVGTVGFDSDADVAWDACQGYGSPNVVIAIIDTGVDLDHPDLRLVTGYDFGDNDAVPEDDSNFLFRGHGTACAGIAAAIAANGTRGVAGVAGGCSVMPLKVSDTNGNMFHSAIRNALVYAADNGAPIASMSFAGPASGTLQSGITYAATAGVTLFGATGNLNDSTITYPAAYTEVVAIGAASPCGERKRSSASACDLGAGVLADPLGVTCDGERWWGSNYGAGIDFIAPTIHPTTDIAGSPGFATGAYYLWFNGTSCSTPYAAGVAALILSQTPGLTPGQVKQAMINGATDVTLADAAAGYDLRTGYGMVNAANAIVAPFADATSGALGDTGPSYGAAWGDYDGDGDPDLYMSNWGAPNRLFRNDGASGFTDVTTPLLAGPGPSTSAVWGDADNDGDLDLYLANYAQPNQLFRNDGAAGFADATAGPIGGPINNQNTMATAWTDYDRDGDVDLYAAEVAGGGPSLMFSNDGCGAYSDAVYGPHFEVDVNSIAVGDYDNDGDSDFYVGRLNAPNRLFRNDGGTFVDATSGPLGASGTTRGVAWGDYDNDGDLDLFLAKGFGQPNRLFRNDGGGVFFDYSPGVLGDTGDGHDAAWVDHDLDGDLDLYVANRGQANKLYRNDGSGAFRDISAGPIANAGNSIAAAWADYDRDGDPDLYLTTYMGANKLIRNGYACGNHWLEVRLAGILSNAAGIGARVRVVTASRSQIREISGSSGFMGQAEPIAMFGLGSDATAESLIVRWPSGTVQVLAGVAADQFLTVSEPSPAWVDVARGVPFLCDPALSEGAAWGDYEGDGDVDLYFSNFGAPNRLVRNDGNGSFSDVTSGPLGDSGRGYAVVWGDYDHDGDLDLFAANDDGSNRLFRNDGGGSFADVTPAAVGAAVAFGAAWADVDQDGDLDLYLARYGQNKLFRNDGGGAFTDATSGPLGGTLSDSGCAFGDYDNDGDPDLYVTTAQTGNTCRLLRNDGSLSFTDVTASPLDLGPSSSAAWGDADNDGDLDLYVARGTGANKLLRNDGGGSFADVTSSPVDHPGYSQGIAWGDYDNDGDLDLYLSALGEPNHLYRNDGGFTFTDVTSGFLADAPASWGQGVAWADIDADGDLDLYLANYGQANRLLRNDLVTGNHWLHVDLVGTSSNADGIGARVRVVAGALSQIREVEGGMGLFSQNSLTAEFGVGSATSVDTVQVLWPSGIVQTITSGFTGIPVDRRLEIEESETSGTEEFTAAARPAATRLLPALPNPFRASASIRFDLAAPGPVVVRIYDVSGRLVRALPRRALADAATHRWMWDGRDDRGREAPAGVYLVRFEAGEHRETRSLVRVR